MMLLSITLSGPLCFTRSFCYTLSYILGRFLYFDMFRLRKAMPEVHFVDKNLASAFAGNGVNLSVEMMYSVTFAWRSFSSASDTRS